MSRDSDCIAQEPVILVDRARSEVSRSAALRRYCPPGSRGGVEAGGCPHRLLAAAATTQVVVQTFQKEGEWVEIRLRPGAEQLLETAVPDGADAVNRLHSTSGESDDHRALITWGGPTGNQACGTEAADPPADSRFGDSEKPADLAELQRSVALQQGEKGIRVSIDHFISVAPRPHRLRSAEHQHRDLPFHPAHDVATLTCGDFRLMWRSSPVARLRLDVRGLANPGSRSTDGACCGPAKTLLFASLVLFPTAPIRFSSAAVCAGRRRAPRAAITPVRSRWSGNRGNRFRKGAACVG